ncbi:MAG: hypothetical protein DMG59_16625 [Acidobacteria bacterium]|nr:MAG: hypothetical protein DMG59_16625 [Acidobacteriota bacterium]
MNRKLIFLNLILLTSAVALGWRLRVRWLETQAHERAIFEKAAQAKAVLPPPPAPRMQSVKPADYLEVAQKMLFSKDRNPTVVIEPPPPKPEPPMPALPSYHGQMGIGEPVVILSFGSKPVQKRYHAGEQVGDFTLVSFDNQKITLDWKGKAVERKLEELVPKEPRARAKRTDASAASRGAPTDAISFCGLAVSRRRRSRQEEPRTGRRHGRRISRLRNRRHLARGHRNRRI